ncbi:MAG: hypothetical protein H6R38_173 [Deltaproteobacteria bacterium]|nr:hypothetical protein [Deltaproteobacteria bacterium]
MSGGWPRRPANVGWQIISPPVGTACSHDRGEHALREAAVHDAAGTPPVGQGGQLGRAVADHDMNSVDPGGLKQTDDPLQNRHPAEHHQGLEFAHALRGAGRQHDGGRGGRVHAPRPRARACTSSATMLKAISSGVSAPMSRPMGECTRFKSDSVNPCFSSALKM